MPLLARFGLVLLTLSLLADLSLHALGSDGYPAHVAIFVAMLIVVAGIVQFGLHSGNAHLSNPRKGNLSSHAHR